jgi:hypothetical protein
MPAFLFREEVVKNGGTYAADKGLSAGTNPPALIKK